MNVIFDSRDTAYKSPFGAVKQGHEVTFTLRVPVYYGCTTPYLCILKDGQAQQQILLKRSGEEDGKVIFSLGFFPQETGLYFYYFDLWVDYRKLYRGEGGRANENTQEGHLYQLTVYDANFETPTDVHGGVMYQIFPDRFFEGTPGLPQQFNERIYRTDKAKEPYFWPDNTDEGYLTRDFFGGDLLGIEKKLPYLVSLGVNWLYLNPVFEAHSNHRYNTADYMNIDPDLGSNEDFTRLCKAAKGHGIKIILDGVFSHTGSDSIYFNREGRYPTHGAYQGSDSPYRDWFYFAPDGSYKSWWGFETLPECNKENPGFRQFICGEGGVIDTWLKRGAAGFRLDVADELPDDFIAEIRTAVKRNGSENLLIGEVWEDASNKTAYHERRRYFEGKELDGVMNYPFRDAILRLTHDFDTAAFGETVISICENYPPPALAACTTHLSTHDTVRAITAIAGEAVQNHDRNWQSARRLPPAQYEMGVSRMKLACLLQFTLPGVPCIYYGDEIGMQGYKDPFNRMFFEWGSHENRLKNLIEQLAALRKSNTAFANGTMRILPAPPHVLLFERRNQKEACTVALNLSGIPVSLDMPNGSVDLAAMRWVWQTHT